MISVCTALMNRGAHLTNLYQGLAPQLAGHEWLVADFGSTDIELASLPALRVLPRTLPFHKTAALNQLAREARGERLFFLDADMLVPRDFLVQLQRRVSRKRAWFPICYSLHEGRPATQTAGHGWWRKTGFGNCGLLAEDFHRLGGWDEQFRSWGKEDDDLYHRCRRHGITIQRERYEGFFHQWHPNDLAFKNRYYLQRL